MKKERRPDSHNQRLVPRELRMTAAKIAHEIASPLNSMLMTIQLLERDINVKDRLSLAQVSGKLSDLKDDLHRLNRLVNELRCIGQPLSLKLEPLVVKEAKIRPQLVGKLSSGSGRAP